MNSERCGAGNAVKIRILVKQFHFVGNTYRRNQTINGFPNSEPASSTMTVDLRRPFKRGKILDSKNGVMEKNGSYLRAFGIISDSLKNFAEN